VSKAIWILCKLLVALATANFGLSMAIEGMSEAIARLSKAADALSKPVGGVSKAGVALSTAIASCPRRAFALSKGVVARAAKGREHELAAGIGAGGSRGFATRLSARHSHPEGSPRRESAW
jgi:hypothetical protein